MYSSSWLMRTYWRVFLGMKFCNICKYLKRLETKHNTSNVWFSVWCNCKVYSRASSGTYCCSSDAKQAVLTCEPAPGRYSVRTGDQSAKRVLFLVALCCYNSLLFFCQEHEVVFDLCWPLFGLQRHQLSSLSHGGLYVTLITQPENTTTDYLD